MGMILGKVDVEEPSFQVLMSRTAPQGANTPYDIRSYGVRYAIETSYDNVDKTDKPFFALARYIGVIGEPENEGKQSIAMTAPVVMENDKKEKEGSSDSAGGGEKIAMTAPVVMKTETKEKGSDGGAGGGDKIAMTAPVVFDGVEGTVKTMQFILPSAYDSLEKIPKPTNPAVSVKEIPANIGAVHQFSGNLREKSCRDRAKMLWGQLKEDGVDDLTEEEVMTNFQFWGYNPPWTIPFLKRNEVFIELTKKQVDDLVANFGKGAVAGEEKKSEEM